MRTVRKRITLSIYRFSSFLLYHNPRNDLFVHNQVKKEEEKTFLGHSGLLKKEFVSSARPCICARPCIFACNLTNDPHIQLVWTSGIMLQVIALKN